MSATKSTSSNPKNKVCGNKPFFLGQITDDYAISFIPQGVGK